MDSEHSFHRPVLLEEVVSLLSPRSPGKYLDCTVGGGGHARMILERSAPEGLLWGLDRDKEAIGQATRVLEPFRERVNLIHTDFRLAREHLAGISFDGILLDLGVSSYQLETAVRGFSCDRSGPLDIRMNAAQGTSAAQLLAESDERQIGRILRDYGEEPFIRKIARAIINSRNLEPVLDTGELAEIVRRAVPRKFERKSLIRVFQALRIWVNDELGALEEGVDPLFEMLLPEGRLAVISYHSLEDRRIKRFFNRQARPCICPPGLPVCACNRIPLARVLTPKPVRPQPEEIESNPRSRSARLRVLQKLPVS